MIQKSLLAGSRMVVVWPLLHTAHHESKGMSDDH